MAATNKFLTSWIISFLEKDSKILHECTNRITYPLKGYVTIEQKQGKIHYLLSEIVAITHYTL